MKYRFPITFEAMFALVMKDPKLCRGLLERIFPDKEIEDLKLHGDPAAEVTFIPDVLSKRIRLDVLFKGADTWYDIEMQTTNEKDLIQRASYYHSSMAVETLKRGDPYSKMKTTYVIFLCCFDPYGEGAADYFFEMVDRRKGLIAGERRYTIILNSTAAEEVTPTALKALFRYMRDSVVTGGDRFVEDLDSAVRDCNADEGVVKNMATLAEELERRGNISREEGREEGREEREREIAREMKKDGAEVEMIMKYTGMTKEEIEAL